MDAVLMQITLEAGIGTVVGFLLGVCLMAIVHQMIARTRAKTIAEDLQRQIDGAKREAENIIKSAKLEAASEAIKRKEEFTAEANQDDRDVGGDGRDSSAANSMDSSTENSIPCSSKDSNVCGDEDASYGAMCHDARYHDAKCHGAKCYAVDGSLHL